MWRPVSGMAWCTRMKGSIRTGAGTGQGEIFALETEQMSLFFMQMFCGEIICILFTDNNG